MNDILCDNICRCCLCSEEYRDRSCRLLSFLDLEIFMDDIECIHLLSLVLMQSLYLNIIDGIFINIKSLFHLQVILQICLLSGLYCKETVENGIIVYEIAKFLQLIGILLPAIADQVSNHCGKFRVAGHEPAAECDSVCLIVKLLRIELVEVI